MSLEDIAQEFKETNLQKNYAAGDSFTLLTFLTQHGIKILAENPYRGGKQYFVPCFNAAQHSGDSGKSEAAVFETLDGKLGFDCRHDHCKEFHWSDFRNHYEPGYKETYERVTARMLPMKLTNDQQNYDFLFNQSSRKQTANLKAAYNIYSKDFLYGLLGDVVKTIEPYTEADPVGVAINLLLMFSSSIGHTRYFTVEYTRHYLNLFAVTVGHTSTGRKGTAGSAVNRMFQDVDSNWLASRNATGLSSGEGLISLVRDPQTAIRNGKVKVIDQGVEDKRVMITETEFSQTLKVMSRAGNILSDIFRNAWDGKTLQTITKNSPLKASDAHISILGHITPSDLAENLTKNNQGNGFANRILWFFVQRSKLISNPVGVPLSSLDNLIQRLKEAYNFAIDPKTKVDMNNFSSITLRDEDIFLMTRDVDAEKFWDSIYYKLSEEKKGLAGDITSRAAPQVMRLACIYALLDLSSKVKVDHLKAALALWHYSEASVKQIFGNLTGNQIADRLLALFEDSADCEMSSQQIYETFSRHVTSKEIMTAMGILEEADLVIREKPVSTGGRPKMVWRLSNYQQLPTSNVITVNVISNNDVTLNVHPEKSKASVEIKTVAETIKLTPTIQANSDIKTTKLNGISNGHGSESIKEIPMPPIMSNADVNLFHDVVAELNGNGKKGSQETIGGKMVVCDCGSKHGCHRRSCAIEIAREHLQ